MPPNTRVPGSSHQHTQGYHSENQATCHLRFAYLEGHSYTTDTPSLIHCFELWHVLAVILTSSIGQLDGRRDALVCSTHEGKRRGGIRGKKDEKNKLNSLYDLFASFLPASHLCVSSVPDFEPLRFHVTFPSLLFKKKTHTLTSFI